MSAARFLSHLRERGIELRADGDKLVVNAPKGAVTETVGDDIRRRKPELLAFLRMGADAASTGGGAPERIARSELVCKDGGFEAPASFGQRRLFYLDQLEPGQAVYNVPIALWLRGTIDPQALRSAIDEIIRRHAVLRTTLRMDVTGLVQRVSPEASIDLEIVRLDEHDDPVTKERKCREILLERACRSFDLSSGPLFRATLIQVDAEAYTLLLAFHHVVTDGWSVEVFEAELMALYAGSINGTAPSLPALPIQYSDYSFWQSKTKDNPERQRRLQFWKDILREPRPILELPTANARPQMAPTEGDVESASLPFDLLEPLTALGRRDGATLFMVLLAAYATLLSRVSGQNEIVIGTPIANRTQAETLDLIGYFANTLALRIDMTGSPTFRELLRRVREVCTNAYANQDIPFEELVDVLEIERDLSRSPVFQTIFAFEDAMPIPTRTAGRAEPGGVRVERRETVHAKVARSDLSVWVSAAPDGLLVSVEYPTALFDVAAVRRLLSHFRVLLRAIADGADNSPIDQLPLLSVEERNQILVEWNDTTRPLPDVTGAHELFERQVDASPDRTAIVFGERSLTFAELDRRANQLAHHLIAGGAGRQTLVGVFIERSPEMVIALLAVLKIGGTYVPLDPAYPADRVAFMIEDSKLALVLTSESLRERLSGEARLVVLDRDAKEIDARSTQRPPAPFAGLKPTEDACYVIYTSGSTGRPKGVVVHHSALVNFLCSMARRPGVSGEDTLLAVTTLSFDIAGLEVFLPLSVGAKLVIATTEQASDGDELRRLVEGCKATVMQATPSTWRLLIGAGWAGSSSFKVLCGGEAFPPDLATQLHERAGSVWNMYGPTETTIWSTCAELSRDDPRVTIGGPIDNTAVYVLDPRGQPTPIGVPGELVIGGLGVSHGYLHRPELTSARFVDDPFRAFPARMYRTGDLAAFRADGFLVYHRRLDHQVKVRGYRIELGEIETVLGDHEAIAQCVVIVREDRPGDSRLVAYWVPRPGGTVTVTDLRKHLRTRLPEYMIPQHLVELSSLPLTPAGKINRKELPVPAGALPTVQARTPSTAGEVLLAKIWAEVLGHDRIGAADNFFDIGGHSLLSMVVVARIRAETDVKLSPRDLLLSSLEQIATQLPAASNGSQSAPHAPQPVKPKEPPREALPPLRSKGLVARIRGKIFG